MGKKIHPNATYKGKKFRKEYLRNHPLCEICQEQGIVRPATELDHRIPIARGGAHFDVDNVQALCSSCHRKKCQNEDWKVPTWRR